MVSGLRSDFGRVRLGIAENVPIRTAMDIKGLARNILPFTSAKSVAEAKNAKGTTGKTDADNDREGNGSAGGEEQKRRKLSQEEIAEAVKYLESLPGIKDNALSVRVSAEHDVVVVLVEDRDGKIVRRIPENELAALTANKERKSGHLLNKAL